MKTKKSLFVLPVIALVFALVFTTCSSGGGGGGGADSTTGTIGKPVLNQITYVEANPNKGFNYGYYYYIPQSIQNAPKKYILVEPNNSGGQSNDIEFHKEMAKGNMNYCVNYYVREVGCAVLVPVFPRPWDIYAQSLTRAAMLNKTEPMVRLDLQLIQMVDDLREKCQSASINLEEKFLMGGYSSSGKFVNRFTAMHPELVQAAAAGGLTIMPILPADTLSGERLIYPVGIADLQEITGKPFNLEQYKKVPPVYLHGRKRHQ